MKSILAAALIASSVILSACSDADGARQTLEQMGYTNIQVTGYSLFGCDERDTFRTAFTAISPNGTPVDGVVCSGWFKGNTVRF